MRVGYVLVISHFHRVFSLHWRKINATQFWREQKKSAISVTKVSLTKQGFPRITPTKNASMNEAKLVE